jgi:hypothetical protein
MQSVESVAIAGLVNLHDQGGSSGECRDGEQGEQTSVCTGIKHRSQQQTTAQTH